MTTKTLHVSFDFPVDADEFGLDSIDTRLTTWISEQREDPVVNTFMVISTEKDTPPPIAAPEKRPRKQRADRGTTRRNHSGGAAVTSVEPLTVE